MLLEAAAAVEAAEMGAKATNARKENSTKIMGSL
jgi:hypothetical protein